MSRPSGSSIERGVNCPASFALPQAARTGEAAIKGTENHDGIEADLVAGRESNRRIIREVLEGATEVQTEVAYALDPDAESVRFLGFRLARNYGPLKPSEIALTVDAVVRRPGDDWVWDWKSRKRVTPAAKNWQLKAGAVCVMKHLKLSEIGAAIGYLDNDESDCARFDAFDIPTFFADMRSMMKRIREAQAGVEKEETPAVHAGPWCDYCPAVAYCPAHTRLALNMLGELDEIRSKVAFMTPEQVSKAYDLAKKIENLLETVSESLRLRIKQEFIPRPNNRRLALVDCERKGFDHSAAKKRLEQLGESLSQFEKVTKYSQIKEVKV